MFKSPQQTKTAAAASANGIARIDLKPDPSTGTKSVFVRLIGFPFEFRQYTDKKRDGDEEIKTPFPDEGISRKKYNRIGPAPDTVDIYGEDVWKSYGFIGSNRFAWNVLLRDPNDIDSIDKTTVAILEKGNDLLTAIQGLLDQMSKKNARAISKKQKPTYPQDLMSDLVWLGGTMSVDIEIEAKLNPKNPNRPTYVCSDVDDTLREIDPKEIALLKKAGHPSNEEMEYYMTQMPWFKEYDYPDWTLCGYQLFKLYKPDEDLSLKAGKATKKDELDMSDDEDGSEDGSKEDEPEEVKPKRERVDPIAVAKANTKPKTKDAFEDEEDAKETAGAVAGGDDDSEFEF